MVKYKRRRNYMRIALTYENNQVFQHFGRCQQFKIYELENNQIKHTYILDTNGIGHGALAGLLHHEHVDVLICGGIGQGARVALNSVNIQICPGTNGNCDELVQDYISGNLIFDPNTECHHHDHEHTCDHTHSIGKCGL